MEERAIKPLALDLCHDIPPRGQNLATSLVPTSGRIRKARVGTRESQKMS